MKRNMQQSDAFSRLQYKPPSPRRRKKKRKTTETIPGNSVNSLSVTLATADAKTSLTGLREHEVLDQAGAMTWQTGLVQQMRRLIL